MCTIQRDSYISESSQFQGCENICFSLYSKIKRDPTTQTSSLAVKNAINCFFWQSHKKSKNSSLSNALYTVSYLSSMFLTDSEVLSTIIKTKHQKKQPFKRVLSSDL